MNNRRRLIRKIIDRWGETKIPSSEESKPQFTDWYEFRGRPMKEIGDTWIKGIPYP